MAADIAEQPSVYANLLEPAHVAAISAVAEVIAERRPQHVVFTARGTSDHAALYGTYLAEIRLNLAAGLASPSAITVFGARPDLSHALVVGVSQSGGSPDLTEVLRVARESGALTLAVTNNPSSTLAQTAELSVDVAAGHERAVAATKTYTAELFALLMLIEGIRAGGKVPVAELASACRQLAEKTLAKKTATELAQRYRFAARMVTTGRGYSYPSAREAALKLMETSYLPALAFSGADLLHGPLAMTDPDVPVLAFVGSGPGGKAMAPVLDRLQEQRADVVKIGPQGTLPIPRDRRAPRAAAGDPSIAAASARAGARARRRSGCSPRAEESHCDNVMVKPSTLRELVEEHTGLNRQDIDHLQRLAGDWQLISDLSFADLLLWVPAEAGAYVCVAQVRPTTAPTAYQDDQVGKLASGTRGGAPGGGAHAGADLARRRPGLVRRHPRPPRGRPGAQAWSSTAKRAT